MKSLLVRLMLNPKMAIWFLPSTRNCAGLARANVSKLPDSWLMLANESCDKLAEPPTSSTCSPLIQTTKPSS